MKLLGYFNQLGCSTMGTKFGPIVQCETDEMNKLIEFSCEVHAFTLFGLGGGGGKNTLPDCK